VSGVDLAAVITAVATAAAVAPRHRRHRCAGGAVPSKVNASNTASTLNSFLRMDLSLPMADVGFGDESRVQPLGCVPYH
jgi:hypothetical protein